MQTNVTGSSNVKIYKPESGAMDSMHIDVKADTREAKKSRKQN